MKKKVLFKEFVLIIVTIIWGGGFIFQSLGGKLLSPFTLNFLRSILASVFLFVLILINKPLKNTTSKVNYKSLILGGFLMGIALATASVLQQIGINNEGAGKSGFLTSLYVIFVPFIGLLFKNKLTIKALFAAILSLIGLYLINYSNAYFSFSYGSICLILCAFCFAFQIIFIDKFSKNNNPLVLSFIQFLTCTIIYLPLALIFEIKDFNSDVFIKSLPSILYLGIGSSGVAYTLQVYAQKNVNATVSTIIMSLESVFSLIFGILFLKESHTLIQYIGCLVIFTSVIFSQIEIKQKK